MTDATDYDETERAASVPEDLRACHTARLGGYVIEGHVPFAAIAKFLTERSDIDGTSVRGMPGVSPGIGSDPAVDRDVIAHGGDAGDGVVFHTAGKKR